MNCCVIVLSAFLIVVTASGAGAGCAHDKWACGMRAKEKCNGLSDNNKVTQCLEESDSDCESQALACENLPKIDYDCWHPDHMVIGEEKPATGFCRKRRSRFLELQ
jgi:hypothetical protein